MNQIIELSSESGKESELETVRKNYNDYLDSITHELLESKITQIEREYNSGYLTTKQWSHEKRSIINNIISVIDTARQPFFEETSDNLFENSEAGVDLESIKDFIKDQKSNIQNSMSELMTHLLAYDELSKVKHHDLKKIHVADATEETPDVAVIKVAGATNLQQEHTRSRSNSSDSR